jgi:ligand-binding SRPBCC domain-containing protein
MHILLKTQVEQSLPTVWSGFNRSLFEQLAPSFPPVKVIRFDGCLRGDVVHLQLNFFLFRQDWISRIIDQQANSEEILFIDQGIQLPFFLAYWQHHHRLQRLSVGTDEQTIVVDDITFKTPFWLTDYMLYPILWLQFAYRKPIYRRMFRNS